MPLVTRGRLGGKVRRHFAHPPGQAPVGGHGPETVSHITTKHLLAAWAWSRPGVDRVRLEQWTEDHDRRADVEVLLRDGTKVALEAQRKLMTDDGWRARHRDYARQGVVDVWFWRPRVHFPHVVLDEGLPVWFYSVAKREAATSLGRPHARTSVVAGIGPVGVRAAPSAVCAGRARAGDDAARRSGAGTGRRGAGGGSTKASARLPAGGAGGGAAAEGLLGPVRPAGP